MTAAFSALGFGSPQWLWGLLALPVFAGLFLWAERQATVRLARLIQVPRLRAQLTGAASAWRRRLRYALLLAGWAGLLVAMAAPRLGYELRETHRRGLDLILAVDVSKSMLATDIAPNRLTRAKLSVQDLVGQLTGDRLGLVAFAGSAFLQAPLTVDYDAVLAAAAELDTDLIPRGGTNIGGAIDLALEAFGKAEAGNRAIVLLSDGEPTSEDEQASGVQAATRAAAAGVKIFAAGLGTPEGSLIPLDRNGGNFVRDEDGKIVRTRLSESGLREIATAGGGFYVHFTSGEATMREIVTRGLSQLKAGEIDAKTDRRPIERYQWPLGAGLVMLGLAALVGERRKVRSPASPSRESQGTRHARAAVATVLAGWMAMTGSTAGAAGPSASPDTAPALPSDDAMALYRSQRYDDAYRAFEDLAKKNPDVGGLQFNAGASAYEGKQYDEALDAFGRALTANDADLQAKSHYNFGNTLFRRGEAQKDRDAKLKDWKNALQHYDNTLEMLKRNGKNDPLAGNTAYNRDLVQKRLDEELNQPPPPQQQKQDQSQKQDDQSKQDQQQKPEDQKKQDQQKQDQSQKQDQQNGKGQPDQPQGQQQQKQDQENQQDKSDPQNSSQKQDQQSQPQPNQTPPAADKSQQKTPDANQPPKPDDKASGQGSRDQPPDPSTLPNQDKPRQRGEFQSQTGSPTPSPEGSPSPTPGDETEPTEESGKMSPAQARALLDSLKSEDQRVMLNGHPGNRKKQDEPVIKDW